MVCKNSQAVHDYLEKIARDRVNGEGLARQAKFNLCTTCDRHWKYRVVTVADSSFTFALVSGASHWSEAQFP